MSSIEYPITRRDESVHDDYFGAKVNDPYRWLENPDSEETKQWVEVQNEVTNAILEQCPNKEKIFNRVKEMQDFPQWGTPAKRGNKYYYRYNSGLQNQSVLYVRDSLEGEGRVFLDPNLLSNDGTVSLGVSAFSKSGKYFAYSLHYSGSDWQIIHVKDAETGKDLEDKLEWVRYSGICWTNDNKGFYYNRYTAPKVFENGEDKEFKRGTETEKAKNQAVYYHVVGTPQSEDQLIYIEPLQPDWMFGSNISDDGRYYILTISESCAPVNRVYVADLEREIVRDDQGRLVFNKFIDKFEAGYFYITNDGPLWYFLTNKDAPRKKIIQLDITNPSQEPKTILAETEYVIDCCASVNGNQFLVLYVEDVKEILYLYSMDGTRLKVFDLPSAGAVVLGSPEREDTEFFFSFTSFLYPGSVYHYDFKTSKQTVFAASEVKGFDPELFETEQIFSVSKDGTKVPSFVIKKKGLELNGQNPCFLYGYGGFNVNLTPVFSPSRIVWMQHLNGILVVANLRGGNEYGEEWHQGGIKQNKQNTFDDFIATAENLISKKYTSPSKLAILGGSNGGLLVAACVNQHPELFGVGISQVGVLDMLRFHKFTIGIQWCSDYGCSDNEEDFRYLIKYSPLHTIKKGKQYPAVMLTTADHDDRVVPAHSFKYISELQYQLGKEEYQKNPLIIRIDVKAGHGYGKPTEKRLQEISEIYAFIAKYTGAVWHD